MQQTKPRFGRLLRPPAWKQSWTVLVEKERMAKTIGKANEKRKMEKVKKRKNMRK